MNEAYLLESVVGNWLWSVAKDLLLKERQSRWPDFELRGASGESILLELKAKPPNDSSLAHLAGQFRPRAVAGATFVLVTPKAPGPRQSQRFSEAFSFAEGRARWIGVSDLPELLGRPAPGPWDSPATWASLQTEALVEGLNEYKLAPRGSSPYATREEATLLEPLARQFSYETVARLSDADGEVEDALGLGKRCENVSVVLSDIVNFSSLVTASRPDDLREAMAHYYEQARQAVFQRGGMLDKFIGDAVLAVFGYPFASPSAPCDAIKFAIDLVQIGESVLASWQEELNAVIDTGTRVGIATGDIWPINIGKTSVEVTLLGDTINLAARLEKNCEADALLVDNRTHTAATRVDGDFVTSLNFTHTIVTAAGAKGQAFPIRAWAMPPVKTGARV